MQVDARRRPNLTPLCSTKHIKNQLAFICGMAIAIRSEMKETFLSLQLTIQAVLVASFIARQKNNSQRWIFRSCSNFLDLCASLQMANILPTPQDIAWLLKMFRPCRLVGWIVLLFFFTILTASCVICLDHSTIQLYGWNISHRMELWLQICPLRHVQTRCSASVERARLKVEMYHRSGTCGMFLCDFLSRWQTCTRNGWISVENHCVESCSRDERRSYQESQIQQSRFRLHETWSWKIYGTRREERLQRLHINYCHGYMGISKGMNVLYYVCDIIWFFGLFALIQQPLYNSFEAFSCADEALKWPEMESRWETARSMGFIPRSEFLMFSFFFFVRLFLSPPNVSLSTV